MANSPRKHIRSLAALFAFEAAGRHRNFTLAASELGVTQAAVSKQIALLEEDIGARLFDRLHREVRLTEKGRELFGVTTQALGTLSDAVVRLRISSQQRPVTIGATLTMSHYWLLPKLPSFRTAHPDLQIRVVSQDEPIALSDGSVDMVIRFGSGRWDDGLVTPLFKSLIYPMASPGFLQSRGPVRTAEDILALPIIEYDAPDPSWTRWTDWLREVGLPQRAIKPSLSFSRYSDAIQAASADQGVALVWGGLTGGIEERGGLVRLPGAALTPTGDFYLVVHETEKTSSIAAVANWLQDEARIHDSSRGP